MSNAFGLTPDATVRRGSNPGTATSQRTQSRKSNGTMKVFYISYLLTHVEQLYRRDNNILSLQEHSMLGYIRGLDACGKIDDAAGLLKLVASERGSFQGNQFQAGDYTIDWLADIVMYARDNYLDMNPDAHQIPDVLQGTLEQLSDLKGTYMPDAIGLMKFLRIYKNPDLESTLTELLQKPEFNSYVVDRTRKYLSQMSEIYAQNV